MPISIDVPRRGCSTSLVVGLFAYELDDPRIGEATRRVFGIAVLVDAVPADLFGVRVDACGVVIAIVATAPVRDVAVAIIVGSIHSVAVLVDPVTKHVRSTGIDGVVAVVTVPLGLRVAIPIVVHDPGVRVSIAVTVCIRVGISITIGVSVRVPISICVRVGVCLRGVESAVFLVLQVGQTGWQQSYENGSEQVGAHVHDLQPQPTTAGLVGRVDHEATAPPPVRS